MVGRELVGRRSTILGHDGVGVAGGAVVTAELAVTGRVAGTWALQAQEASHERKKLV